MLEWYEAYADVTGRDGATGRWSRPPRSRQRHDDRRAHGVEVDLGPGRGPRSRDCAPGSTRYRARPRGWRGSRSRRARRPRPTTPGRGWSTAAVPLRRANVTTPVFPSTTRSSSRRSRAAGNTTPRWSSASRPSSWAGRSRTLSELNDPTTSSPASRSRPQSRGGDGEAQPFRRRRGRPHGMPPTVASARDDRLVCCSRTAASRRHPVPGAAHLSRCSSALGRAGRSSC